MSELELEKTVQEQISELVAKGRNAMKEIADYDQEQVEAPFGDGAKITALRPFNAIITLLAGVAPGLVDGQIAPTTPTGLAISIKPYVGSSCSMGYL